MKGTLRPSTVQQAWSTVCEYWGGMGTLGGGLHCAVVLGSWLASAYGSPLLNIQEICKPLFKINLYKLIFN